MIQERKNVTVHYRRLARTDGFPADTLEHLIRRAMGELVDGVPLRNRYTSRVHQIGNDRYFINTFFQQNAAGEPLVFGDVIHFTRGHLQALLEVGTGAEPAVPVQQMQAPALKEYVHSQMFWMVKGDHVFVIQSMSLRTEEWERYLTWLLSERTNLIPAGTQIVLAAKFDASVIGGDLSDIKEIIIGGTVAPAEVEAPESSVEETPVVSEVAAIGGVDARRAGTWEMAKTILASLMGGEARVNSLMADVPEDAELQVSVHIGYKTRKRQVDRTALRSLETGLRNLPDSQLSVMAKGATKAVDGTVRLHHSASIRLIKAAVGEQEIVGSLLDPADVLRAAYDAYTVFVTSGKISP